MDLLACILKIYPDWKGAVWGNSYAGIQPHRTETRAIPTMEELEAVWQTIEAETELQRRSNHAKKRLAEIDLASIRSIREWLADQPNAPQWIKNYETEAIAERAKI